MAFQEPTDDFSNGLGVLRAYHQCFLENCKTLRFLAEQVENASLNEPDYEQAKTLFHFLATATERHHQDEEQVLFPKLASAPNMLHAMMDRLEQDHAELEQGWEEIGPLLAQPKSGLLQADFPALARRYAQLLQWHIEREDANFLPQVEEVLGLTEWAEVGQGMLKLR